MSHTPLFRHLQPKPTVTMGGFCLSRSMARTALCSGTLGRRGLSAKAPLRCFSKSQNLPEDLLELPLSDLQSSLDDAVLAEEYEKAVLLRDVIKAKEEDDALLVLERELQAAIEREDYTDAARCRDAMAEEIAKRPPAETPSPADPGPMSGSGTTSSKMTEGVRIDVQSIHVPAHSGPQGNMFAYQITITNVSHPTTIKLISRHWEIKDSKGRERIVDGEGVVGAQPELEPGQSFTYSSNCPIQTATGSMKGHFEFYSRASATASWNTSFLVDVAEFRLDVSGPRAFD